MYETNEPNFSSFEAYDQTGSGPLRLTDGDPRWQLPLRGVNREANPSEAATDLLPTLAWPTTMIRGAPASDTRECCAGPVDQAGHPDGSRWCCQRKAKARFAPPLRDSSFRTLRRVMFAMSPDRVCLPRSTGLVNGLCCERFLQARFLQTASLSPRPRDAAEDYCDDNGIRKLTGRWQSLQ